MTYIYLLGAGLLVSVVHCYLVWRHRDDRRYSLSEHAMLSRSSRVIYFVSHLVCEVLYFAFSYQFFIIEHDLPVAHYLNVIFVILDFVQALLPSRGKTKKVHFISDYVSRVCYLLTGVVALVALQIAEPYKTLATLFLIPIVGMFVYMHINHSKLYPYQLLIVPLFVVYMLFIVMGASK